MPFTASLHPKPFRIYGFINQARLTILIDSGNTHNFIQPNPPTTRIWEIYGRMQFRKINFRFWSDWVILAYNQPNLTDAHP